MWIDTHINPDWIIEGEPKTRCWDLHRSRTGGVSMNYWDCTAGRFHWHFGADEMVQILEGEVHVTGEDGHRRTLRAGDTAHFAAGTSMVWEVDEYVRKLAFHRSPQTITDRIYSKALRMAGPQRAAAAVAAAGAVGVPVAAVL